ncbi:MAG: tRNA pseudouridine(55) synthase TruB [Candidatus Omnitrophota bacterium]|nr:tRNA pseudouridine(55) synthase TruB [Candidatus Omnitrophota bacterium]RKY33868.1 MAG: tRNA pseudouridine(55) synthase TruB [Candidatus Omnitrophota bacterium]
MTKREDSNGLILVNKPRGLTSHDVVNYVRKKLNTKRVGHAGTLDPQAEGLLIILVGRYTKFFSRFVDFDKEYQGIMKLGEATTTGDAQGEVVKRESVENLKESAVKEVFPSFVGEIEQVPPMVSAIRIGGKRLYKLARRGIVVERPPRKVKIYDLKILKIELPFVEFYVRCSKGTYVRKLAEDIGEKLGCGAHITSIIRTAVGPFTLREAVNLEDISATHLREYTFE